MRPFRDVEGGEGDQMGIGRVVIVFVFTVGGVEERLFDLFLGGRVVIRLFRRPSACSSMNIPLSPSLSYYFGCIISPPPHLPSASS